MIMVDHVQLYVPADLDNEHMQLMHSGEAQVQGQLP